MIGQRACMTNSHPGVECPMQLSRPRIVRKTGESCGVLPAWWEWGFDLQLSSGWPAVQTSGCAASDLSRFLLGRKALVSL